MPHTYIVQCSDGSYYVGSTWDLDRRVWQHNTPDQGPLYTRRRRPVRLVWSAWFESIKLAYQYEKRIQGWSRKKREALIRGDLEALSALSRRKRVQERQANDGRRDA
jgi:putative endonuclease